MNQPQGLDIDQLGTMETAWSCKALGLQHGGQSRELVHRKPMPRRHLGAEGGVVNDGWRHLQTMAIAAT
jgi:hypothetical protein